MVVLNQRYGRYSGKKVSDSCAFLCPKVFGQVVGPILGTPVVCQGLTTSLSDTTASGTWVSSMSTVATVSGGGIVTGLMAGTSTISYTAGGVTVTQVVTVYPTPGVINGPSAICDGSSATLSDFTAGGVWSSSSAVATIGTVTGVVTGLVSGTTMITYALGTCYSTKVMTINPLPSMIAGVDAICIGYTTTLSDAATGGSWMSTNTAVGTVGSGTGIVSGIIAGTTQISYTLATGCSTSVIVTVNVTPTATPSSYTVCVGGTVSLTGTTGGTWSSSTPAIVMPFSGGLEGVSVGTSYITYALPTGCFTDFIETVNSTVTPILGTTGVCVGLTSTLSDATPGGTWSSANVTVATVSIAGVVTGIFAGTDYITYSLPTGCMATTVVTVYPAPGVVSGATSVCVGGMDTLTVAGGGGTWGGGGGAATITPGGVVSGIYAGSSTFSYTMSTTGCSAVFLETVTATVASISGSTGICVSDSTTLSDATTGGVWISSFSSVAFVSSGAGVITGVSPGTSMITYQLPSGCYSTTVVTVNAMLSITASATSNCGGTYSLNGTGAGTGGTYVWGPSTGLSCSSCATSVATISSTSMYTVTGTDINGCVNTNTVSVNGNRISGYITMTVTPTDTLKVWLIRFNSTDSSLIAEDSTLSCLDGTMPYYEFDNDTAGSYMVKAKLLSSVPGTSGYVPTYGLSSSLWSAAATITHASATDTQHINMIYGTVPTGPGFIGGLISTGAGRNTAGAVPAVGMLVYLKDAANNILTYTYTDVTGAYSFSGLANGSYNIYPVDYKYNTTAWIGATINSSAETFNSGDFYQHTTLHTITPYGTVCCGPIVTTASINLYPNPAMNEVNISWNNEKPGSADIIITDMTGREVYKSILNISAASANTQLDIHSLNDGIYFITIKSSSISYTNKLVIQR